MGKSRQRAAAKGNMGPQVEKLPKIEWHMLETISCVQHCPEEHRCLTANLLNW